MLTNDPLVSIIMPVFNSGKYLVDSINSVINQEYVKWELLIINDGSCDNSEEIIHSYSDSRIYYFKQKNRGVSAARNVGLENMRGDFFCFLDSDDILPQNSLIDRLCIFNHNPDIEFVDGKVQVFNNASTVPERLFCPEFQGLPFRELISLSGKCFFGPTWMIKRRRAKKYQFLENLTHGEDLLFYISIGESGLYSFTTSVIYQYRSGHESAMSNINSLESGYFKIYEELKKMKLSDCDLLRFKRKIKSIMFKSYLSKWQVCKALKIAIK
ncbi:glycosyltransferase [Fulvivirga maritima]|uniref:glycosyltransferase family 2 protein n=1 Tax=Fulvivirga maritima TaxID=2904247 RepID=UPI001F178B0D|nr:glycosyltransferase [Fulvivirga maritima]UII27785.1 glycosyltransferase [Fulvivirga maritima]